MKIFIFVVKDIHFLEKNFKQFIKILTVVVYKLFFNINKLLFYNYSSFFNKFNPVSEKII